MNCIEQEFKGKDERHVVLDPDDLNSLASIAIFSKNAIRGVHPWNNPEAFETYARVIEWFAEKVKQTSLTKPEKEVR